MVHIHTGILYFLQESLKILYFFKVLSFFVSLQKISSPSVELRHTMLFQNVPCIYKLSKMLIVWIASVNMHVSQGNSINSVFWRLWISFLLYVCVFCGYQKIHGIGLLRSNVQLWERGQGSGIVFKIFHPVAVWLPMTRRISLWIPGSCVFILVSPTCPSS